MALPWTTLDRATTPEGPLELRRRGERDFHITLAGRIVMTSSAHRSEDALARLACERVADRARPRVLISGLGMGYTLRAALDVLPPGATVLVAELNPVVLQWCRGPLSLLSRDALGDARVQVEVADVSVVLSRTSPRYDVVALDLYEGPGARIRPSDPLYGPAAVRRTMASLGSGGTFAVWSEQRSIAFEDVLAREGLRVDCKRAGKGGRVHVVYLATR